MQAIASKYEGVQDLADFALPPDMIAYNQKKATLEFQLNTLQSVGAQTATTQAIQMELTNLQNPPLPPPLNDHMSASQRK